MRTLEVRPAIRFGPYDTTRDVSQFSPRIYGKLPPWEGERDRRPGKDAAVQNYITYLDTNWAREGLPSDWFNLRTVEQKHVGFVLKNQMDLLQNIHDKTALSDWAGKTERDLQGFKLEFLSDHNVYTRKYEINRAERRIEEPQYGLKDGKPIDIVDTISDEERNGSVKESLGKIKEFLLDAPDGAMGIMNSPLGKTGFKTPDGRDIDYMDSYFFLLQKQGDKVMNYTIKTDFTLPKCREVIKHVAGKNLPVDAPLEDYVRSIALIRPGENGINNIFDVVRALENVQPGHAFKDEPSGQYRTWQHVYEDILKGEELYNFDKETTAVIQKFTEFAKEGGHTKEELQKAIAVTVLRMSELFFKSREDVPHRDMQPKVWISPQGRIPTSFGEVLNQTAERRGCSGGGQKTTVSNGLGTRLGIVGGSQEQEWFKCPKCNYRASGPVGNSCPDCGLTKEAYAEETGISCD